MANKYIKIIITSVIVITISLIIFSITYAWFVINQDYSVSNFTQAGQLEIIYANGQDINGTLSASRDNSNALSTTATIRKGSSTTAVDALATIRLNVQNISQNLAIRALKWEVYQDSNPIAINSGTFEGAANNSVINLIDNYLLTTENTTFTIKIWLNGAETTNNMANLSLTAYIDAVAVNAPENVS